MYANSTTMPYLVPVLGGFVVGEALGAGSLITEFNVNDCNMKVLGQVLFLEHGTLVSKAIITICLSFEF